MTTKITLRESNHSISDFSACLLILLFQQAGNLQSSVSLPVAPDGTTNFTYENNITVIGNVNFTLKSVAGNILLNQDIEPNRVFNTPSFELVLRFTTVELGVSRGPVIHKSATINGKLLDSTGLRKMDEIQIIIFAGSLASPPSELQPILSTITETGGYFYLPYPEENYDVAYAVIGVESATNKNKIDITLEKDDGGNYIFPKRMLLVLEAEENAVIPAVSKNSECDCNEFNFHEQKRILDEFSFYSIIRTSDPEIKAYSIEEEEEISLDDLLKVSPTSSNPIIKEIAQQPISVFGHALSISSQHSSQHLLTADAGAPIPPQAVTSEEEVSEKLKDIKIKKKVVQQFLVTHKVLNKDTYMKLLEMNDAAKINAITQPVSRSPLGRITLDSNNQVDYDKDPTVYEATTIAYGHLLHFKQQWVADGYSLGDLLYSLPLAPGQKKQIVITDFDSTVSGSESQDIEYEESLDNSLSRDRDINEIASGIVNERVNGSSSSTVKSGSAGLGLTLGPLVFGASGGISKGSSSAAQNSMRSTAAQDAQHLSDQTVQSANAVRSQRSTVVRTVTQRERYAVTTESIANYNHCHAITIEYFQVMRHFKVQQRLVDVQECLFVPLPITKFDIDKARRWKDVLLPALRDRGLRRSFDALQRVKDSWEHSDFPATTFAAEEVINLTGTLKIKINLACPADKIEDKEREIYLPTGAHYTEKYTVIV